MADISKDASVISDSSRTGSSTELETIELLIRDYQGVERFGIGDFGSTGRNGVREKAKIRGEGEAAGGKRGLRSRRQVQEQSTPTRLGKSRESGTQTQALSVRTVGTQTQ